MSIEISKDKTFIKLNTANTSYVMMVNELEYLEHLYYGAFIHGLEECAGLYFRYGGASFCPWREGTDPCLSRSITMQEYTSNEIGDFKISSVSVRSADGVSCVDPRFVSAKIRKGKPEHAGLPQARVNGDKNVETLEVLLRDPYSNVEIVLYYTVFPEQDVIVRSVKAVNKGKTPVYVERLMSFCLDLPQKDYDLVQTSGVYFRERWTERNPIHSGVQGFYSKRSSSGHFHSPAFALAAKDATEFNGDVYGGIFVYSGDHSLEIEVDGYNRTRIVQGINPENFEWKLAAGESFQSPEAFLTFSAQGLNGMSHNFHDMLREHLISPRWSHTARPILVNNWEATYFNFDRKKLLSIAKDAAELGIEMLVLDDGWFGHRDSDNSSLGDWFVYKKKIGSLKTLVSEINKMGLKFGLWFEPEMISRDSELHRAHPEWVFTVPYRPRSEGRKQFVLNLGMPEVVDYLFETISAVLKSANIEYIKWDMNRNIAEKFNALLPADQQKECSHRYVLGVYELSRRLLEAFPDLFIEGCSGGGGRFDAGMLYYNPQIWTSDDTDAIERLRIQSGTSLFYPCSSHGAHVSVCPNHGTGRNTPFVTRGNVALAGTFGYELDLNKLSAEDREAVKQQTQDYHKLRHLVADGDFYRLITPDRDECQTAWQFTAKDGSEALFIYVQQKYFVAKGARYVRLKGLIPDALYLHEETGKQYYGSTLMNGGITIPGLYRDGDSVRMHFKKVTPKRKK